MKASEHNKTLKSQLPTAIAGTQTQCGFAIFALRLRPLA
ncbi:hypothetical protein AOR13_2982 [Alteromonas stellipolaris LMG 21856]|nr:hypothetical protein AOR13_2982 [Alteromonas stellipolaris LMG 21856]